MCTFFRAGIVAIALLSALISTDSESAAERPCIGRRCRQPVAHAPARPQPQRPSNPSVGNPTRQCTLPVAPLIDLHRCDRRGHGMARAEYTCDIRKGMDLIDGGLTGKLTAPIKMCRLLLGELRANCCQQLRAAAIQRCQQEVAANAQRDRKCVFKPPCARKLFCPVAWIFEEKRSQCCTSLKPQGIALLKAYCESRVNAMTGTCSATILPQPSDGYVTIQPVGTPEVLDPNADGTPGDLPEADSSSIY